MSAERAHLDRLRDFTADARLLILTPMAALVGAMGALGAYALVWLIGAITKHRWLSASGRLLRITLQRILREAAPPPPLPPQAP